MGEKNQFLTCFRIIIESYANCASVVAVVLSDDLLAVQFPESSVMVRACRDEIRGIGTEGTVPNPSLMTCQGTLQSERLGFRRVVAACYRNHLFEVLDLPDLGRVVCAAGCEMFDVWREQDSGNVLTVSFKVGNRD